MARELARVRWVGTPVVLDPNLDNFGVSIDVIHALRGAPGEPRRKIKAGVLECQRCVQMNRSSTWVYLRTYRDRLIVAHHASGEGPCYLPEGPEHLAWKERIAADAERAGFAAVMESSTKDRSSRADVLVTCADGQELAWEVQMSPIQARQVLQRSHNAVRQGRLPSWLTTDLRAGSPTRALINRAPWSMVTQIVPEQIRAGRAARVLGGLRNFAWRRCIELPGRCPLSTGIGGWSYDCGDWHGVWEKVTVPVEDFVGKTAAGLYVPIAIPGVDGSGVMRIWVRPQDHDAYAEQHGHRFTEQDLPEGLRIGPPVRKRSTSSRRGRSKDSKLHVSRSASTARPRPRSASTTVEQMETHLAEEVQLPVLTVLRPPSNAPEPVAADQADTWFEAAVAEPCRFFIGDEARYCQASPTRLYARGRRCFEHAPDPYTPLSHS
ncbi:hypothetical protein [Nocardiopsis algeriensis]|uniref:Competence protein CoiA nuclease-like domain-containing protein n=1 Tax=Nocardiopsis algeriensis TaxID=1478215 RepID=A0A841IU64_9ACTN|nr:hypothetical protein [Nocardiopsis algeriensis]MBB6122213.1 hypothetical protein [Nocardiopsis algeriensis]